MDSVTTMAYDADDEAWVVSRGGEELGRNHRVDREDELGARKWTAWLTGQTIPFSAGEQAALQQIRADTGTGVSGPHALLQATIRGRPGHVTDEYTQHDLSVFHALACTSLPDDQALERARSCPSGTSGGWVRTSRSAEVCPQRPDTHRHIFLEAG